MGLVLGMMACLFLGCFSIRVVSGNSVPAEQVRAIEPGVTTRAEILEWFGAPEDYTDPSGLRRLVARGVVIPEDVLHLPYADVLVFERVRARAKGVFTFFFNAFEVQIAPDRLVVFFDDEDHVLYYGYRAGADALE
jgi:hypothetical protein